MIIKKLKTERIKEIAPLMLALYEKWDSMDPIDKIDKKWFSSNNYINYLKDILANKNKLFLIAEENNKIISYLLVEIEERKPFLQKVGYMAETYTLPKFRERGIGSALFKNAIVWFGKKKIKWIVVSTHSLDNTAISFWEGRGFKEFNKFFKL